MDFEFRYRLEENKNEKINNLNEYYREMINSLLDIIEFTHDGEILEVNGFKFVNLDEEIRLHKNI